MKKLILLLGVILLTSGATYKVVDNGYSTINVRTFELNGMTYAVFYGTADRGSYQCASPAVVNLTKDKAELKYYQYEVPRNRQQYEETQIHSYDL